MQDPQPCVYCGKEVSCGTPGTGDVVRLLPCGHSACASCALMDAFDAAREKKNSCLICRTITHLKFTPVIPEIHGFARSFNDRKKGTKRKVFNRYYITLLLLDPASADNVLAREPRGSKGVG